MSGGGDQDRRTIDPTPQRIRDFRERGEIARSKELTGAATMLVGGLCVAWFGSRGIAGIIAVFRGALGNLGADFASMVGPIRTSMIETCLPPVVGAGAALIFVIAVQLGAPPALAKPSFDLTKPFTLGGLKEMVNPKAAGWRVIKSVLKVVFVAVAGWLAVSIESEQFLDSPALTAGEMLEKGRLASLRIVTYAGGALMVLAIADYVVAKRRMAEKMKMTPEEFKRDMRQQEGDPEVNKARRRRMQEMGRRRIAVEVPNSDFVVVNPTHYAVALRYRAGSDGAPKVVAKGADELAARIRELARNNGVPIISKPPLARLLFRTVKEGKEIPSDLFGAVAEILSYVYRLRRRA